MLKKILKTILITGCSSGIGLRSAEILRKKGYRVFATARKPEDVQRLKSQGFESFQLDISDSISIQKAVTDILQATGGTLDALFNNSGFAMPGAVEDMSRDMMRAQFETNVFGTMELTNLILPVMRQQGHGRIIQNGSILGIVAMPFRGNYCASKFALEAFSNTLRQELRGTGISVSMIEPGPIETAFRVNAQTQYRDNLENKSSIHRETYTQMEKSFFVAPDTKFTLPPDAVVKKLLHALESKRPKAHYYVGSAAHIFAFLRRILPDSAMDFLMYLVTKEERKL